MLHSSISQPAMLNDNVRRNSPEGLMLRYVRGRLSNFKERQTVTFIGGFILALTVSPLLALFAMSLALAGEIADCVYLRRVPVLLAEGVPLRQTQMVSTITAGVHALTISICVSIAWLPEDWGHPEPLFAIGFLTSAALNATLVAAHHPAAARVRLIIYGLTPIALFAIEFYNRGYLDRAILQNFAGASLLMFTVGMFLKYALRTFESNRRHTLALEEQRAELADTNLRLREKSEQARRLAAVAQHANDSVILIGQDGRISWVNSAFSRITGFSAREAVGRRPGEVLNSSETSDEVIRRLIDVREKGLPYRGEVLNRRKDGKEIWVETNQVPVLNANGSVEVVVAVERDVTQAREQAAEMEEARRAAEDGARVKEEFLATMSHEIRTPMNGVIGMARLLTETDLDKDQRLYSETILSSANALMGLINDVLDLSKLDAGRVELSVVDFSLLDCFESTLQFLRPQAEQKRVKLELSIDPQVPDRLRGDDRRLRQILLNLVGNAIKFTEIGSVHVSVSSQDLGEGGQQLIFSIADTGIGIPADKLDHIFTRFSQADAATTRKFGGTGLGLTISRKLTEAMDGSISVSSELGKGTCFTVTVLLDRAHKEDAEQPQAKAEKAEDTAVFAGLRLLVAEDNKVNRLVIQKYLRSLPIQLEFAFDGHDAVSKTLSGDPDLVFMDMSMPVMSGLEATREIRATALRQPVIIALTANAFDSDRVACLDAGMDGFLTKPVGRSELLQVIRSSGVIDRPDRAG